MRKRAMLAAAMICGIKDSTTRFRDLTLRDRVATSVIAVPRLGGCSMVAMK